MKKTVTIGLVLVSFFIKAQDVSVEKKLFGVQFGLLSSGFQYETKLQRKMTLMTELGLTLVMSTKEFNNPNIKDKTTTIFAPYLSLEPRWYYGLDRRNKLGRNIKNNSSNFISLKSSFISSKTPVIKNGSFDITPAIFLAPMYGIRRSFAKNFNYQFSGGYGYQYNFFSKSEGCNCKHFTTDIDLQASIGYNF
ncbi:MAG: hypothetical protein K9I26_06745 [Flavobacterium sp.]|nr:hypothetical protein [Flavobacterium sp.]